MPEEKKYPYENGKFYWVEIKKYPGGPLKGVARFDDSLKGKGFEPEFYLTGSEEGIRVEAFDKIHPEPIPEPE